MKTLKGGKFLGEGGYGCVIKPALPCTKKNTNILKKTVSKIIMKPDENIDLEININNLLIKLDPYKHFFITPLNICYLNDKSISGRKDIEKVEWNTNNNNDVNTRHYYELEDEHVIKLKDKKRCLIDMKPKPINIIMPYGGYNLDDIFKKQNLKHKTMHNLKLLFFRNFKLNFKHLLKGLKIMHDNRIVHQDIKPENIMISFSKNLKSSKKSSNVSSNVSSHVSSHVSTKSLKPDTKSSTLLRYIDFGLSTHIFGNLNYNNIDLIGTYGYISPELYIIFYQEDYKYDDKQYIMVELNDDLQKYYKKIMKKYKLNYLLKNYTVKLDELYDRFVNQYNDNSLLKKYFGIGDNKYNGYLQKGDVYSLAITIIELFSYMHKNNPHVNISPVLHDLLVKMIEFDPDERYNVNQCLSHSYFT